MIKIKRNYIKWKVLTEKTISVKCNLCVCVLKGYKKCLLSLFSSIS